MPNLQKSQRKIRSFITTNTFIRRIDISPQKIPPLISFTFDDFPQSAVRVGAEILNSYDLRGTFFVSLGLAATNHSEIKFFDYEDLASLREYGHEIGCHTFDHLDCRKVSFKKFKKSIKKNQIHLKRIFPPYSLRSFSYPKGGVSIFGKLLAASCYETCRTTFPGINIGKIDLNYLKANKLYSNQIPLNTIYRLIDQNLNQRGWLIFYTHDVSDKPSQFGCTPSYFRKVISYANHSGSKILPVIDIVDLLLGH